MWELLFRLTMLATLVHEVGHHSWAHRSASNRSGPTSEEHARAYETRATRRNCLEICTISKAFTSHCHPEQW